MGRLAEALKWAAAEGKVPEVAVEPQSDEAVFVAAWDLERTVPVPTEVQGELPAVATAGFETPSVRLESQLAMGWPQPFPHEFAEKLVITPGTDIGAVRAYRELSAALRQRQHAAGSRSVVVTSAAAGDGKTLTAVNLALTLSETDGLKVLLVDAHLAQPRVHEVFGVTAGPGLRALLRSSAGVELRLIGITARLSVLPAGRQDPASPATIDPRRGREVLDRASGSFDWVVIDSPPVLASPDAAALSSLATDVLLVVLAGTPRGAIRQAAQALAPGRLAGMVVNRG